jgi:hypothetical protein
VSWVTLFGNGAITGECRWSPFGATAHRVGDVLFSAPKIKTPSDQQEVMK